MSYYQADDYEDVEAELGESDEAARRRPRTRYQAQGNRQYMPRPQRPGAPSTGQVSNAFEKVGADVLKLAEQLKALELRVDANNTVARRGLRTVGADLQQTKMFSAMLPLLSQPKTLDVTGTVVDDKQQVVLKPGDKLLKPQDNTLTTILPLMLMSQSPNPLPSGDQAQAPAGGMDSNMMMMMVLALSLSGTNK
ncbi:MAG: hypothetical protein ABMA64_00825 [Myxococcota bacterium]